MYPEMNLKKHDHCTLNEFADMKKLPRKTNISKDIIRLKNELGKDIGEYSMLRL